MVGLGLIVFKPFGFNQVGSFGLGLSWDGWVSLVQVKMAEFGPLGLSWANTIV